MGAEAATKELKTLNIQPIPYPNGFVGFRYTIPHGRFRNKEIEIALDVSNFPDIPPPGPNIKPFLLPINTAQGDHPFCGIHIRNTPTAEFQYWSRPLNGWDQTKKTMAVYLAFLRTLFDFE